MERIQLFDSEWLQLMMEAKKLGISIQEVREFIECEMRKSACVEKVGGHQ